MVIFHSFLLVYQRVPPFFSWNPPHFGCLKWIPTDPPDPILRLWSWKKLRTRLSWLGAGEFGPSKKGIFFWTPRNEEIKPRSMGIHEEFRRIMKNWCEKSLRFVVFSFRHHFPKHQKRWKISLEFQAVPAFCNLLEAEIKKVPGSDFTGETSAQMGIERVKQWWYPAWSTVTVCELENGHRNSGFSH